MKILIPITGFGAQGGFRVLSELANHWILLGNDVEFLVYKRSILPYFPTNAKINWYDNDGAITSGRDSNYKKPLFRVFSILNALRKAINTASYDVIVATHSLTAFSVRFSKPLKKKIYYIQAYEPEYYPGMSVSQVILRTLSRMSYKLDLEKIVNSPLYLKYKEIEASKYVYPGIDFTVFKPEKKPISENFIIGCIGRIEPYKGTSYVLEAFMKLRKQNKNIELRVAFGDKNLELMEGVAVPNINGDRSLADFYNSLNVLVAPGTYQLGAVHYPVIEAMSCKIPVVTTGYYPANEINSWIVPIKDSAAIEESLISILKKDAGIKLKVKNAFDDTRKFDWRIVSRQMLSYFEV